MAKCRFPLVFILVSLLLFLTRVSAGPPPSAFDELESHGFPRGLLPDTVETYSLKPNGEFEVSLAYECYATINSYSKVPIHYSKLITGKLKYRKISNLNGIGAKVPASSFFWYKVATIFIDNKSSDIIHFATRWGFQEQLAAKAFYRNPICDSVAKSRKDLKKGYALE